MWSRPRGELNPWIGVELSRLGLALPELAEGPEGVPPSVARLLAVRWAPTYQPRRGRDREPIRIGPPWEIDGDMLRFGELNQHPISLDLASDPSDPVVRFYPPGENGSAYLPLSGFLRDLVPVGPGVFRTLEEAYANPEAVVHLVLCESEAKWVGRIERLVNLEVLDISFTIIQTVEKEIRLCPRLRYFAASDCWLTWLPSLAGLPLEVLVLRYTRRLGGLEQGIAGLDRLVALDLHGTEFDTAPEPWPELPALQLLALSHTKLERLPSPLPRSLRSLDFALNYFSDISPVLGLAQLEELDLSSTVRLSTLPDALFALPALRILRATSLGLRDLPESLGQATKLEVLHIGCSGRHSGIAKVPPSLFSLTRLEVLWLDDVPMKALPEEIGQLRGLRILGLSGCKIGRLPDTFTELALLEQLEWRKCNVKTVPELLARLPVLGRLDLTDNALGQSADLEGELRRLAAIPALRSVNLHYNKFKDEGKALARQRLAGILSRV